MLYRSLFFVPSSWMKWLIICLIFSSCSWNSNKPFYNDIQQFKIADKASFPPEHAILFVGSSSFRKWTDVQSAFPGFTIVNRGFGGSDLNDLIRYAPDIIIPYHPKQIVIYCGDNDIAAGNVTATDVLQRFMNLFKIIRDKLPNASVVFVSIKPSPSRIQYKRVMEDANIMIRQFLATYPETDYVDVYHPMLDSLDKPRADLFVEDSLHMNQKGYALWQEAILPHLKRY